MHVQHKPFLNEFYSQLWGFFFVRFWAAEIAAAGQRIFGRLTHTHTNALFLYLSARKECAQNMPILLNLSGMQSVWVTIVAAAVVVDDVSTSTNDAAQ